MSCTTILDRSFGGYPADLCARLAPVDRFGPKGAGVAIADGLRWLFRRRRSASLEDGRAA
jgi:hypothetical protein